MLKTVTKKKKSSKVASDIKTIKTEMFPGPKYSLQFYVVSFAMLLIVCPHLTPLLYERSKDHMRWLNKYRTPTLDFIMHFYSTVGDGGHFPIIYTVIWALSFKSKRLTGLYLVNYL